MDKVSEALNRLTDYIEAENHQGYDPYDIENARLPIGKLPHLLRFALSQINKRSPVNLRPVLGISKNYHTKAMGLFLAAYCNLYQITNNESALRKARQIFAWIKENKSNYSKNVCWGFDYSYSSRNSRVQKGFPTVIHHSYVVNGLFSYFKLTQDPEAEALLLAADQFILEDIPHIPTTSGICFGYNPEAKGCCYNASLHAAESLAIVNTFKNDEVYETLIHDAVKYVISRQKPSGVWYYSHMKDPSKEKKQIDFHQGFILDSLDKIDKLTNGRLSYLIQPAVKKGLKFYLSSQFDSFGRCFWRLPVKHPTDIHNQAQGILTFSRFSNLNSDYSKMTDRVVDWTITNMQDKNGFFYYQKYPLLTNKISHIRWGQAWMFYALTFHLLSRRCFLKPN